MLLINSRVDDRSYFDLGVTIYDSIKNLVKTQTYENDEEIIELIKLRTKTVKENLD